MLANVNRKGDSGRIVNCLQYPFPWSVASTRGRWLPNREPAPCSLIIDIPTTSQGGRNDSLGANEPRGP